MEDEQPDPLHPTSHGEAPLAVVPSHPPPLALGSGGGERGLTRSLEPTLPLLDGEDAPLPRRGLLAAVEGLLRSPANVLFEVRGEGSMRRLLLGLLLLTMAASGLLIAASAGGLQLLAVPLKVSLGMLLCAVICLPSLYIFAALSGGRLSLRETWGALLMGVALTGILMVGFAPVSWVLSQATESRTFLGSLHLFFFLISAYFGLRVMRRAMAQRSGRPIPAIGLWSFLFLVVVLQMSTTLRPLIGPFEGLTLQPRQFFLEHWLS